MSNDSVTPKVSVIVPVYNAELYLQACIDSICKQTLHELEIIIINDGSTDSSGSVADRLAAKNNRIRVIHQRNRGLSSARNKGISLAEGTYISFIDADDWIDADMLQSMYQVAESRNLDVVVTGVTVEYTKEGRSVLLNVDQYVEASELTKIRELYISLENKKLFNYAWNKLYSSRLLREHQLCFGVESPFEDEPFNMQTFMYADRVGVLADVPYHYIRNDDATIVASYKADYLKIYQDKVKVYKAFFTYLEMSNEWIARFYQNNIFSTYCLYIHSLYKQNALLNRQQRIAMIQTNIYDDMSFMQTVKVVVPANVYEQIFRRLVLHANPSVADSVYSVLFFLRRHFVSYYQCFRKKA